jgi:hypothetical protein
MWKSGEVAVALGGGLALMSPYFPFTMDGHTTVGHTTVNTTLMVAIEDRKGSIQDHNACLVEFRLEDIRWRIPQCGHICLLTLNCLLSTLTP